MINRDHVIATLTGDVRFKMEMVVENGRGYVPATEHTPQAQEIGIIPLDAAFSPVTRVRYEVDETRVGQKTNYDRLTIEIWTNGSVNPEMALVEIGQDSPVSTSTRSSSTRRLGPMVHAEARMARGRHGVGIGPDHRDQAGRMSLAELDLSVRATNCLESGEYYHRPRPRGEDREASCWTCGTLARRPSTKSSRSWRTRVCGWECGSRPFPHCLRERSGELRARSRE